MLASNMGKSKACPGFYSLLPHKKKPKRSIPMFFTHPSTNLKDPPFSVVYNVSKSEPSIVFLHFANYTQIHRQAMDATLGSTNPLCCFPLANHGGTAINRMSHRSIRHLSVMCHHKEHNNDDSTMNGDDGKKARGALKAGMVMACMLGAMCVSRPMCTLAFDWPRQKQMQVQPCKSMKSAVDKLVGEDAKPKHLLEKFRQELKKNVKARDYKKLSEAARKLRNRGELVKMIHKEYKAEMNKAVEMLVHEYNMAKDNDQDHAYHLGRLLVELLIYQGHYSKAEEYSKLMRNVMPADGRLLLLEAVTNLMLSDLEGAETCLEAYKDKDMSKPPF